MPYAAAQPLLEQLALAVKGDDATVFEYKNEFGEKVKLVRDNNEPGLLFECSVTNGGDFTFWPTGHRLQISRLIEQLKEMLAMDQALSSVHFGL